MDRIKDCADLNETAPAEVEKAYRRGFAQGMHAAFLSLNTDFSDVDLELWTYAVDEWRRKGSEWKPGEQVKVVDPLQPIWVRIPLKDAINSWKERM